MRTASYSAGLTLSQRHSLSEVVGRVLASRGLESEHVPDFLEPTLEQLFDPSDLKDMDVATDRLVKAITSKEVIGIFGDYDVDGSCATALLNRYFRALNQPPEIYIPDRLSEGYGPNDVAMERLKAKGVDVVITVDCGSIAYGPMAKAAELGMDVIITDHHQTRPEKPACVALVNPNRIDEVSPHTNLSGAGVAFMMLVSVNRALRKMGYFNSNPMPDLRSLLDLVAVSSVCDMVPVTGVNRILINRGLKVMARRQNVGLRALSDVCGIDQLPGTYHAGFLIGPRINAGGRIAACDLGARLLSTDDTIEAQRLAEKLHALNLQRQEIEQEVLAEAMTAAEKQFDERTSALVVAGKNWHPGVVGIVAARVKEKFHRPVFIIGVDESGMGKGSGRSIDGIDLGTAVMKCGDILEAGGGHKMAAGLTVKEENIPAFRKKLNELVAEQAERRGPDVFVPHLSIDGHLRPYGATMSFLNQLEQLEPFGIGNPEPRFAFSGILPQGARIVGEDHLKLRLTDADGGKLDAIAFRAMQSELGPFLMNSKTPVTICGKLRRNVWNGYENVQLLIDDARPGNWEEA